MESEYLFQQQLNDLCFLAPMISLRRLEALLANYEQLADVPAHEWRTRREWFGKELLYLDTWYRAIERVNDPDDKEVEALRQFARHALLECPVTPHFYDASGRHFFSGAKPGCSPRFALNQLQSLTDFALTPFLFIDLPAFAQVKVPIVGQLLPEMGIRVPLVRERRDGPLLVYNQATHAYDSLIVAPQAQENGLLSLTTARTAHGDLSLPAYHNLARWREVHMETQSKVRMLGYHSIARAPSFGRGMILGPPGSPAYAPYMAGMLKLMLCTIGVDENNQAITPQHPLYPAHRGLRAVHNAEPENNTWSARHLTREGFLQLEVAELLRREPNLFERVAAVVSFANFSPWRAYTRFLAEVDAGRIYKDRLGQKPYDAAQVRLYLPGPEQLLALSLTNMVRLLWYGTLNESAFHRYTGPRIPFYLSPLTGWFRWTFDGFRAGASRKRQVQGQQLCFLDVWQEVRQRLTQGPRRHWFSFDYHGWVMSLDDSLIAAQRQRMLRSGGSQRILQSRLALLEALGCTGIDTSHSRAFDSFYKRDRR